VNHWPIPVYRDVNEDMIRTGDPLETTTGINQHHGYGNTGSIGRASAGCLVGRTVEGHREFMKLVKSDVRYKESHSYRFMTTIIPGDELLETPIHPFGHEDDLSQITWIDIFRDPQEKLVIVGMNEGTAIRKWTPKDKAEFLKVLQSCYQANTVLIASADKPIPEL